MATERLAERDGPERSAKHVRVLMYFHDGFGLGHVRRTQAIANALACERPGSSIVILSGSPLIHSFEFRTGIDFVCVPGVEEAQGTGVCTSRTLNMSIEEVIGCAGFSNYRFKLQILLCIRQYIYEIEMIWIQFKQWDCSRMVCNCKLVLLIMRAKLGATEVIDVKGFPSSK